MNKNKVWLVMAEIDEYEDMQQRPLKMFNSEKEAIEYRREKNKALDAAYEIAQQLGAGTDTFMVKLEVGMPFEVDLSALKTSK